MQYPCKRTACLHCLGPISVAVQQHDKATKPYTNSKHLPPGEVVCSLTEPDWATVSLQRALGALASVSLQRALGRHCVALVVMLLLRAKALALQALPRGLRQGGICLELVV